MEGTTNRICGRDVRIHSGWIIQQKYQGMWGPWEQVGPDSQETRETLTWGTGQVATVLFCTKGGGRGATRGDRGNCKGQEHVRFDMYVWRRRARTVMELPNLE
jgi:hypothetical protein